MQNNKLIERIRALGKLTPSEAKIADYFSRNYWNLIFDNTTSISKNTGVSKPTVVRFITKLGYDRFSAFRNLTSTMTESQGRRRPRGRFPWPAKRFLSSGAATTRRMRRPSNPACG